MIYNNYITTTPSLLPLYVLWYISFAYFRNPRISFFNLDVFYIDLVRKTIDMLDYLKIKIEAGLFFIDGVVR